MVKLLVCDDAPEAREALRALLARQDGIAIVAEAGNGEEAIALALEHRPDVVLMDVTMPILDGIAATRRLRELIPATRIVAFTGADDGDTVAAMTAAGASDYCVKGAPLWELEHAISGPSDPLVRLAHDLTRAVGGGVADLLARELAKLAGADYAATYVERDAGLRLAGASGDAPPVSPLARRAVERAQLVRQTNEVAAPLVADGETLGALLVGMRSGEQPDEQLLCAVATLASAALANERRLARAAVEARRDALTGLPNKRAFDEHLEGLLRSARRVSIALVDLDDFKRINDTQGHAAGDRALRGVARVLERVVRLNEEAFRVGGEEFALVVQGDSLAAARVADRVRAALRDQRRSEPLPTVSIGVAGSPEHTADAETLLRLADDALYAAKGAGKDRVVVHGRPAESRPLPLGASLRILLVDDDEGLRILLRTTFEAADIDVDEAESAAAAARRIAVYAPDIVVLDVGMPGVDGLSFCRRLKASESTRGIRVVLLTGSDDASPEAARAAGAEAFLRKPFSPLELLALVERLGDEPEPSLFRTARTEPQGEQLLFYARDLRRLLDVERGQRALLQKAYRETVLALACALESKDTGTGAHSQRVQRYAMELAEAIEPELLDDPSVEYGFLLHDVGKIGVPDEVLLKPGALTPAEWQLMETHTVLGEQMLRGVALLQGEGLRIVRSHHERWDGGGYPDRLRGPEIPLGARVFAIADALDAITSARPYRDAASWERALEEIIAGRGSCFDPDVVDVFLSRHEQLHGIHEELAAA